MRESSSETVSLSPRLTSPPAESSLRQLPCHAETRRDPITGEWTIFAPNRQQRPNDFKDEHVVTVGDQTECPFCAGQESMTPAPLWVGRPGFHEGSYEIATSPSDDAGNDWSVRVVPNLFPAVVPLASPNLHTTSNRSSHASLFCSAPVAGGHEVIIESPNHVRSFTELDLTEATLVLMAYRDRIRYWRDFRSIGYISVFKNVGGDAGASLQHSHSQLIATSQLPGSIRSICNYSLRHHAETGCCLQCDITRAELREKKRVIYHAEELIAYSPFASRLPMLIRITSTQHRDRFEDLDDASLEDVARLLKRAIGWVEQLHPQASYNCLLHTRPPAARGDSDAFHWSFEIFPRITRVAGFEWSSQTMINPVLPEVAAAHYRACAASEDPRLEL